MFTFFCFDTKKSNFFNSKKFADCGGMVLEEQPAKMAEALRHYLQGLGYGIIIT